MLTVLKALAMALHRSVGMGEDAFATFTSMQTIMLCAWHIPKIKESNNKTERQSVFISVLLLLDPRCFRATGLQRPHKLLFPTKTVSFAKRHDLGKEIKRD